MTESSERKLRVFLCYASVDKQDVRLLYERLVGEGIDAWLDKEKLLPGQDWRVEIPKAVRASDIVVVCLSSKLVKKEGYVQKEIKLALDSAEEKPDGTVFVIPARLDDCAVPERLSRWQWVDLFDENGYARLIHAFNLWSDEKASKADGLFKEATGLSRGGSIERALELYRQVKAVDRYYPNIDSLIQNLENEIKKEYVDQGRVNEEQFRQTREKERTMPHYRRGIASFTIIALLFCGIAFLSGMFLIAIYLVFFSRAPTISISNVVRDLGGNPIDMNSAPFQVRVSGTVSNADGYYVYLIVVDKNHHHVQPGLGLNVKNDFTNVCQLGDLNKPDESYSQQYTVYAVITDTPYKEFTWFEGESFIDKSNELKITREPMPTPAVTP